LCTAAGPVRPRHHSAYAYAPLRLFKSSAGFCCTSGQLRDKVFPAVIPCELHVTDTPAFVALTIHARLLAGQLGADNAAVRAAQGARRETPAGQHLSKCYALACTKQIARQQQEQVSKRPCAPANILNSGHQTLTNARHMRVKYRSMLHGLGVCTCCIRQHFPVPFQHRCYAAVPSNPWAFWPLTCGAGHHHILAIVKLEHRRQATLAVAPRVNTHRTSQQACRAVALAARPASTSRALQRITARRNAANCATKGLVVVKECLMPHGGPTTAAATHECRATQGACARQQAVVVDAFDAHTNALVVIRALIACPKTAHTSTLKSSEHVPSTIGRCTYSIVNYRRK
jgi:hypothetical protein